jgi:putative tryptophan/tyrosine transport system substrate-binding protein
MRRRDVFTLIGGAIAAWPVGARAQQADRPKRIGFLSNTPADAQGESGLAAFRETLQQLGWSDGNNARIDVRWGENDPDRDRKYAAELVALAPDVIVAAGTLGVLALQKATRTVPIVFVRVSDPVGAGVVDSLAHPGGNTTGFMNFEYSLSGKWLELLKRVAPQVTRALVLRDAASPAGSGEFGALQAAAPSVGMELRPADTRDAASIERAVATFASNTNTGGMIVTPSATVSGNRELIVELATRHKLPAVYPYRYMVASGGLIAYGPDPIDLNRRAAGYVDRILKGEKPADLPVQAPTKFALVINLKSAKALGLTVPPSLLASADEVIE